MSGLADKRLWFLTGSQHLYGEETLAQVDAQSREVAAALDGSDAIPVPIVHRAVLTTADDIRAACIEASADERCIGVIAWMHTFSPAKMWISGLASLSKPLLHLHTQFNRALPWAEIDMDFMNLNQSAHGDREFGFIQTRLRMPRKVVVGHWSQSDVQARIGGWSRAAAGLAEARSLRVIRFGDNMRDVAVTEGDKVEAELRFGMSVNTYGVSELGETVAEVPDADVDALCGEYESAYEVVPELRRSGERHSSLRDAARIELGIRAFLDERGATAYTDTFEDLGPLRQLPGIASQRLMAAGYGFGAEGDWKTAALLRILKVMAEGLPGGTSFMEDYTYDFGPDGGSPAEARLLGSHMLEVCPSIADGPIRCEIHPLGIGDREDPVRLVFTAAPGPAVVIGMLHLGERYRLVANTIEVVTPEHDLPRLPVARALWRPEPDLATAAEAWLLSGGPHHTVYTAALGIEVLTDLAEMLSTELITIDADTRISELVKELRWNMAYYHLARGL
ncbi:MAG TPA: L-arabinose isomerase [Solirubrobacteraceae bacterium]|nr:L-arabinose isomerase [Solirubrobacteraceae bacterium]